MADGALFKQKLQTSSSIENRMAKHPLMAKVCSLIED